MSIFIEKVKNIGKGGFLFNLVAGGGLHVCVKIYKPLNEKVGSDWFKGNKALYALYNSYTRFSADDGSAAERIGGRGTPEKLRSGSQNRIKKSGNDPVTVIRCFCR